MTPNGIGKSIFKKIVDKFKSVRVRKTTTWLITIAMLLSIFSAMMPAVLAEEPSPVSVVILSPFEYLEPSTTNSPNDKDGYPPQTSSADVEEGILQSQIIVTSTIYNPSAELLDDDADGVNDLTMDDDNPRDLDILDGIDDDALAPGTYYVYWNLDKTGYVPVYTPHGTLYNGSNSASISVVGNYEDFSVKIAHSGGDITSSVFRITMQNSASIKQNDLDWLQTAPDKVIAEVGDVFTVRTLYHQNSANGLQYLISQVYDIGDYLRLLNVSIFYYNDLHPGNISTGVPSGWTIAFYQTMELTPAELTTTDNRDHWVMEYIFEVLEEDFSYIIPYTQTIKRGSTWKIDTGYEGFQSWVPGGFNPANLSISKYFSGDYADGIVSGPNPPQVGEKTVFEINITVENNGGDNATDVIMTDTIPIANVTWEGTYTASQGTVTYNSVTGELEWKLGTLAKNTSATLSFQVSVTPTIDDVDNKILLNAGAYVNGTSDWSGEWVEDGPTPPLETEPVISAVPVISLAKSVDKAEAYPGDELHYEIKVKNSALAYAKEVWVNDTLPTGTTFKDCSPAYDSMSGNEIKWHFINFTTGEMTIYLNVTTSLDLNDDDVLNNTVELLYTDINDNYYPKKYDWAETTIITPIMTIDKVAVSPTADPGDIIEYYINYSNIGSGAASHLWINDTIPEYTTFVSATPTYTSVSGNVYTWHFTNVTPGDYSINLKLKVNIGTPDGTTLSNGVIVDYRAPPGVDYPPEDDTENVTCTAPVMTIQKDVDKSTADPGDELTYTITFKNTGTGNAGNVWVNDTIPEDTTYVSSTPTYTSKSGDTYTWHYINVVPGTYYITLKVKVDVGTDDGTELDNDVSLDYTDDNGNQPYETQYDSTTTTVTAPVMTISKDVDLSTADPGDVLEYTITYKNTGTGDAGHVWINDTIPSYTTYQSSTPTYDSKSGDVFTWHFTNVAPGTYYITLKVIVDVGAPDGTNLVDNVTLEYTDANGNQPYDLQWDTAETTVTAPIMTVQKDVDLTTANPGDELTYTITYKNTGTGDAKNVWINDTIDPETTFVSASPTQTSSSGDTYTWHFTDVAPGTYYITLKVKVDVGVTDGTVLINDVELEYTDNNGNQPYDKESDDATTTVKAPIMTVQKDVDKSTANPGDELTYTITYKNTGTGDAKNVWINDTIDPETTFVSASPTQTSSSGDTYTWHFTDVAPGTYYITLKVKVDVGTADGTILTNNVELEYTDANGNQPYDKEKDDATTTVTAPEFTIEKVADASTADPGDVILYTITYKNIGTGTAKDVWVNDTIPAETTFINSTPAYDSVSGDTYTWHFTNVITGTYKIYINVKVDVGTSDGTNMINKATLDYTDLNGNQPYDTIEDTAEVLCTSPVMTIAKGVNAGTADPGDMLTYTIKYENNGGGTAKDVWIKDTIPADTTYVSSSPSYTSVSGDTYTWHFTNVTPGTYYITLKVTVDVGTSDGTSLVNNATLDYTDANGNSLPQDWDTATTTVTAPVMTIEKVADLSTAAPSDVIEYTITYKNTGTGDAKTVWVNDTIPADTTYVSSTPSYTSVSGDTYAWVFNNVAPGTYYITLKVSVDVGTSDGKTLTNDVSLDYTDVNGNQPYGTQWDDATTTVQVPVMTISKDVDVANADPDDELTYNITYKNTGSTTAKTVWVNDTIPADTTYVSSTPSYTSVSGDTYTWVFNDVTPGTYYITLKVKVDVGTSDGAILVNNVTLDYTDSNGNQPYATQWDTATTTVTAPIMSIDKVVDASTADPDDELNYNITYKNTGTGNAKDVWVKDTIPADTTWVSSTPAYTSASGDTYTWHFTNVATGTYYINIKVKVDVATPDQTVLTNNATLDYSDANGNPYNQQWDTATTTVTAPIMTIDKVVDVSTADPDDVLTYTITYKNTGTGDAKDVWVKDTIPADTTYVSSSPAYTSVSGDTYTWHFTNVVPNTYYITLKVKVDVATPDQTVLLNNATLDYTDANGNSYPQDWDTATTTVTAPVMTITKNVDLTQANPGDVLTYNITYKNTGTGDAKDVWVKDTIPADTTYVSSSPAYTSVSGDTYTWHFTNVAPGEYYIDIKVKVDVGTPDQTVLTNNATLDYTDANGNPYPQDWDTATTTVTAPVMTIGKTADISSADPDDQITYTIKYENTGTGDAKTVWINDTIPADTTYISSSPTYSSVSGDTYAWVFNNVAPGAYYITLKVKVDVGTPDQTVLTNNVTLDYTDANGNQPYAQQWDTATTTVTAPIMTIDKVVDVSTADPDDELNYNITYKNTGTGNAKDVWVKDTIPADTTYVSSSPTYTSVSGDTYTWHFTNVAPGTYYINIKVKVDVGTPDQTVLTNNATLDYTDANGNPYGQQWDTATTTVTAPIMTIDKVVDVTTADPDDELNYNITYKNTGTGVAGDVWIKDTIPADTTFVSSTPAYTSVSGDTYTWHFTNVAPGTYYINIKVKVDVGTPDQTVLLNNATLDYTDTNSNSYPQEWDTATTTVTAPIMTIVKDVDNVQANPDDLLTYTITYKNTGTGTAKDVWVKDTIPADTTYVSSSPTYTSVSGNTYTWHFINVAPGTYYITLKVKVDVGTPDQTVLTNNATLDYTDANGNPYSQQWDTATTTVTAPIMSIDKIVDVATADPDDILTYTITYKNTGTGTAKDVWVKDTIPADTTYVSSSPTYTSVSGDTYTWHFTNVVPGNYYITLKVKVDVGATDGIDLINNATLDYTDSNGNPYAQEWDTAKTTVTSPVMTIGKTVDKNTANPGDMLTYTIKYENTGTGNAQTVWVNDTIPAETTYVSSSPAYTSVSGDTYAWVFNDVAPGTYYITLKVSVDIGTPDQTVLTNNVTLDYTDANGNQPYGTQWDTATTTTTAPIITIDKVVDATNADPDDELKYTITYVNTGTGNAKNVWINDTIPADTTYVSSTPTYTSVSGDTYTWHFTDVAPGNYTIILKVKVDVGTPDKTLLLNNATLEYTDANGNQPYALQWDTATTIVTAPIMKIDKVVDAATADPDDELNYNITYKNTGSGVAGDVWVKDTIPADTTFVSSTPAYTSVSGDTYTWHFTNVPTGTYYINIKVKVDVGTPDQTVLLNNATLDYTDANSNSYAQQWDTATTTVTAPIMSIDKIVDMATADPDDILTYTITYKNTGTGDAGHVWINDTIPADTTFVSANPAYTSVSGDTYSWHFINVGTGTYYITLKVKVDVGTPDKTVLLNNVTLKYSDANGHFYTGSWDTATTTVTAPVIEINKVADLTTANPGDIITYTIYYYNKGTGNSANVYVKDTIPTDTTYVSSSPTYTSVSGNTYTWHFANVAPGNYSITLKVMVNVGTPDKTVLTNSVTMDYSDANDNYYPQKNDTATTTVTAPLMTISKGVDVGTADPGDEITYTIKYENTGTGDAKNVWVNDTIPADTTFVSSTPAYTSASGDTYTWHFTNVGTGAYYITIKVKVDVGTPDQTVLLNNATLDYTDANGNQPYATQWDTATTTVTAPIMSIDKVVDATTADPGDELNYNITYKNTGTGVAKDVWVKDTIPADTTFVSSTPAYTSVSGDTYTWHFTNVPTGTYYIDIKVKVDVGTPDKTVLTNNATLDYTDANGNQPYAQQWDTATTTVTAPIMSIDKVVDVANADPGDELTYNITYKNTGTGVAKDVWVKDTIPADTTYVSSSPVYTSVSGDTYTWHFTNVATGTYYIILKVKVDVGTPDKTVLTNNATLDYTDANGNQPYAQQWDTATTTVTAPVMTITKSVNVGTADPGDVLTYTIKYENTGTGVAKDVWIKDTIPADTTFVSASPAYTSVSGDTYTWHFINVGTGTYYITLKVVVDVGTQDQTVLTNNATLDYTDANGNQPYAQQWDTATTTATAPIISIDKVVDVGTADPGDELVYNITYKNTGTGIAANVWINDTIPADTTFVSSTPAYTSVSGDTYTWHFTNVATGTYYIDIKVKVDVGTPDKTVLLNNATLDYTDANNNQPYAQQWDTATTTVTAPIMSIDKVVDVGTADPGDELNYNITYKNTGTGVAKDVWVKDTIPADTTFVSSTPAYTLVSGDTYTWHFTNVGTGTYYIDIKVKVDVGTPDQTVLLNNATLDYTDANGNQPYAQQWDTATTTVTAPIMSIDKAVDVSTADPDDELTYTITYKNIGTGVAKDVWVKDTIPADTTYVSSSPTYTSVSGDTYTWHFTNVATGTYYITLKVKVDVGTPDQTVLLNNATLDYTDANGNQPYAQQWDTATTTVTAPIMSIDKVVNVATANPGDELTYTITYKNTGTGVAATVWVKDTIPADTTYVSSTPAYTSVSGDTYTWVFSNVGTGTYYITLKVKVDVGTPDQTVLTNNATLDYTDANGNQPYAQQWDTATTTVTAPVITIYKSVDASTADPGDVLTYTIKYENTGTGMAKDVWIKDTIPTDTTWISSTPAYTSVSGDTYTWHFTNITTGAYYITIKVVVDVGTPDKTVLLNNATLDYNDANGNAYPQTWDTATTTVTAPVMTIDKIVDVATADPGDELTYTITFKNTGTGVAANVWINDTLPANVIFVSAGFTGVAPDMFSVAGTLYKWHFSNVGTGTYYITLKVKVKVGTPDKTILLNNATLEYTDANGNQPHASQYDTAVTTVTAPVMSIDKVADVATADPDDLITYTINYTNSGTGIAATVWVNDTIPADTTFVSSTPAYTSVSGDTYTWVFTNVGTGSNYITIKVKVDAFTPDKKVLVNNVTLDHTDANGNQPYATIGDFATVTVTAPVMAISKVASSATAIPGDVIIYTIVIINTGTGVAGTVWVDDTIPAATVFLSSIPAYTSVSGNTYTWKYTNFATGLKIISINVKVPVGTPDKTVLFNNVTLEYTDTNGNMYPLTWDTATTIVTAPVMSIGKVVDAATADPGDVLTYTITYANTGSGIAKDVWVIDTIPADTTLVSTTPAYTSVSGDTYTWHFTNVTTGSYVITVKVRVDVGTPDKTVLFNNATLDYTDNNNNQYPHSWDTATTIVTAPVMSIDKVADVAFADPGDEIIYTITYKNTGTGIAGHVWINDTIPADTTLVSVSPMYTSVSGDTYTWYYTNVGTGTWYITIKVKVDVGTPDRTVLLNNVTLDYTDANSNPYPLQWDTASTNVTAPVMNITKEGGEIVVKSYILADLRMRIAGEKWHDVTLTLYNGNQTIAHASITRYPGDPDEQAVTVYGVKFDLTDPSYKAVVVYTPLDDPINGQIKGDNPCWLILSYENGREDRLHHNFNVNHEKTWIWIVDDFVQHLKKVPITYEIYLPYTIMYNNTGTGVAAHVWVNDTIPAGTTMESAMPNYTAVNGSTYTWYFTNVGTGTYYINITVKKILNDTTTKKLLNFTNNVTLDYTDANGNQPYPTLDANATLSLWIPLMSIDKVMDPGFAITGDYITVTLSVWTPLNMTTVRDTLPAGLVYTGDGVDNDFDGYVDEEALDGIDNDFDGLIDEDVGNFKINGGRITGGLSYSGNKITYTGLTKGTYKITYDLLLVDNGTVNHILTNLGEVIFAGSVQDKDTASVIYLAPNTPPTALIDFPGDGGIFFEDMAVYFSAESSYDDSGNLTYYWDFGDGTDSNEMNTIHKFLDPGVYTVTLTVTDDDSDSDDESITLTIIQNVPVAYIIKPDSYIWKVGHKIWFKAEADYIGNTAALEYEWEFGDGNYGYGFTTSYSYSIPGTYTVILTVSDLDGDSDQVSINLTITSHTGPPKAPPEEEEPEDEYKDPIIIEPPTNEGAPPIPVDPTPPDETIDPQDPTDIPPEYGPDTIYEWQKKDTQITPPQSEPEEETEEEFTKPLELIDPEQEKFALFVPGDIPLGEDITEEEILESAVLVILGGSFISSTFIMEVVLPPGYKRDEDDEESGEQDDEDNEE